jgi:hypothetical protein
MRWKCLIDENRKNEHLAFGLGAKIKSSANELAASYHRYYVFTLASCATVLHRWPPLATKSAYAAAIPSRSRVLARSAFFETYGPFVNGTKGQREAAGAGMKA